MELTFIFDNKCLKCTKFVQFYCQKDQYCRKPLAYPLQDFTVRRRLEQSRSAEELTLTMIAAGNESGNLLQKDWRLGCVVATCNQAQLDESTLLLVDPFILLIWLNATSIQFRRGETCCKHCQLFFALEIITNITIVDWNRSRQAERVDSASQETK